MYVTLTGDPFAAFSTFRGLFIDVALLTPRLIVHRSEVPGKGFAAILADKAVRVVLAL